MRSSSPRRLLLVFIRAPEAGRVKTRLASSIGAAGALRVYRRLAEHTVRETLALAPSVDVRVCYTPADRGAEVHCWLGRGPGYRAQRGGDLGERLAHAFAEAFGEGYERVVVVGSDLPRLSARHLRAAFRDLDRHDAVLGPSRDGGYWLLGLRAPVPELFRGVVWSTDTVLAQAVASLRAAGMEPALLEELSDVDEEADLPAGWREWALEAEAAPAER